MSPASMSENRSIDEQIGRNVRALRAARGMAQEALGGRLGITFQQIQKYEKGTNRMSGSALVQVARVFGVPVGTLFAGIAGAATAAEESGFDGLATRAELQRLSAAMKAGRDILDRGLAPPRADSHG